MSWCKIPAPEAISFTGSTEVGVRVYANSAKSMKKCQCEMGGKNPAIVLADADLSMAAKSILGAAFELTGQRCTATRRVFVVNSVGDELVELLAARARKWHVGNGLDTGIDMGPLVDEIQLASVLRYIEIGKKEARLVLGGASGCAARSTITGTLLRQPFLIMWRGTAPSRRRRFSVRCCR